MFMALYAYNLAFLTIESTMDDYREIRKNLFVTGDRVIVVYTSRQEFNGQFGKIVGYHKEKDRFAVELSLANKKSLLLKPINLKISRDFSYLWNEIIKHDPNHEKYEFEPNDGIVIGNCQESDCNVNGLLGIIVKYNAKKEKYLVAYELEKPKQTKYFSKSNLKLVWSHKYLKSNVKLEHDTICACCRQAITRVRDCILCNGCGCMIYCSEQCRIQHLWKEHTPRCNHFRVSLIDEITKRKYFDQITIVKESTLKNIFERSVKYQLLASKHEKDANKEKEEKKNDNSNNNMEIDEKDSNSKTRMENWFDFCKLFDCSLNETLVFSDAMTIYYIIKHVLSLDSRNDDWWNIYLIGVSMTEFEGIQNNSHIWQSRYNDIFSSMTELKEHKFRFICIGPDMQEAALKLGNVKVGSSLIFEFHRAFWLPNPSNSSEMNMLIDSCKSNVTNPAPIMTEKNNNTLDKKYKPDLIIGLHAGLTAERMKISWMPLLEYSLMSPVPIIVTEQSQWAYLNIARPDLLAGLEHNTPKYDKKYKKCKLFEMYNPFHVLFRNDDINCLRFHTDQGFRAIDVRNCFICGIVPTD